MYAENDVTVWSRGSPCTSFYLIIFAKKVYLERFALTEVKVGENVFLVYNYINMNKKIQK